MAFFLIIFFLNSNFPPPKKKIFKKKMCDGASFQCENGECGSVKCGRDVEQKSSFCKYHAKLSKEPFNISDQSTSTKNRKITSEDNYDIYLHTKTYYDDILYSFTNLERTLTTSLDTLESSLKRLDLQIKDGETQIEDMKQTKQTKQNELDKLEEVKRSNSLNQPQINQLIQRIQDLNENITTKELELEQTKEIRDDVEFKLSTCIQSISRLEVHQLETITSAKLILSKYEEDMKHKKDEEEAPGFREAFADTSESTVDFPTA